MNYFPTFFDLRDKPVLLVGGGEPAVRKLRLLRAAGARVRVVAPEAAAEIADLAEAGETELVRRGVVAGDLAGRVLAVSATGLEAVDTRVAEAAREAGVPVNVVDRPDLSSFIVPAIVDRDPVVIGISSGGAAPVLARRLRGAIEAVLPARLGALARFAGSFRAAVAATVTDPAARRRFWERFFDGPIAEAVLAGREGAAREAMLTLVNRRGATRIDDSAGQGSVAIVGAGPGDPDLLTLRALRLIQEADVVVHDKLVGEAILALVRRDARRVYVGKAPGRHSHSQDAINDILVAEARAGHRVVRLKGGDPFVFGRGGEELEALRRHGIAVEVVPGITAALGCAAATGIPLTHRDHATAVTFVTGHGKDGTPDLDWAALAGRRQTLVVYMGVATAGATAERLIETGLAPGTPVAVIQNGTLPDQRTAYGTLAGLGDLIREQALTGPAVIVIGEVARRAETLEPFAAHRALAV